MRSTTDHVTNVIVPIAATASANASTAQTAADATQRLAAGVGDIESTARSLSGKAAELQALLNRFTVNETITPRQFPRCRANFGVTYGADRNAPVAARARDIGGGGLSIESAQSLPVGSSIAVRFELPGAQSTIEATGDVVATAFDHPSGRYVHHIGFTAISETSRLSIEAYVAGARREILTAPA